MTRTAIGNRTFGRGLCWCIAGALPLLAGIGVVLSLAPASRATTMAPPSCTTTGLVTWLDTRASGAAGSSYYQLRFTNLSGHSCTLLGFPGVSAVDLRSGQVGSAAYRDTTKAVRRVTVANGMTVSAVLRILSADNYPQATCHQVTAAGLRVFPPGATRAALIPFPLRACSRSGPVYLGVGAVGNG